MQRRRREAGDPAAGRPAPWPRSQRDSETAAGPQIPGSAGRTRTPIPVELIDHWPFDVGMLGATNSHLSLPSAFASFGCVKLTTHGVGRPSVTLYSTYRRRDGWATQASPQFPSLMLSSASP